MRFYVDIGVNLELQFIIGLLITVGLVSLGGLSYPNESHLKKNNNKKKIKPNGRIGRIPYDPTTLCDLTRSYIQSYNFCDFATILNFLVRWDRKIARFYDLNRDFDKHGWHHQFIDICKLWLKAWRHEHIEEVVETWKLDQRGRGWNFRTWNLKAWSLSKKKKKTLKLEQRECI